jgi:eukaryotic-like serine/threonine-protein kinase
MIGTTVGKYRIVEKLGRGGMGTVYKAVDETLDREVAIKVLNPDLTDEAVLKRFRGEAVTLARLNHPGIATIYELHHHGDDLLMVMEFVRGETLHDLSDRLGPLNPPQGAHLCMQVLDALAHAHRGGVVHRDLKPANVMITDGGSIKVMDFGIARVLGSEHFTHGGYMMGTPAYMAPEQVLGREIDGRADLYSVGVLFYRLLSGRLPFNADTAISMVQMQISEAPTPIASVRPDLPVWCTPLVERALAKSPSDRFQSAEEFRSALSAAVLPQALGELPTLATPTPPGLRLDPDATLPHRTPTSVPGVVGVATAPTRPLPATAAATPVAPVPPLTAPTPAVSERTTTTVVLERTHFAALAALLLIVVVGVAVLAFAALRSSSTPPATATTAAPTPPVTSPSPTDSALPAPPGASTATPSGAAPTPPPSPSPSASKTALASSAVATAGAEPATNKAGRATPPATPAVADPSTSGRGARATTPKDPDPAPPPPPAPVAAPLVSFNQVRVLISEAGKAREREGVLQLAGGQITVIPPGGGAPIVSVASSALNGLFYARSKQPKWRDASGQEVMSRIDLGPMGFLRGERNWIILLTANDPIILRIEDAALRTVLPALQERTGQKIQR